MPPKFLPLLLLMQAETFDWSPESRELARKIIIIIIIITIIIIIIIIITIIIIIIIIIIN